MTYQTKLFINNEYVSSKSNETISVHNPVDGSLVVSDVEVAGPEDIDDAVAAATLAFKAGPWSTFTGSERARCLLKLADLLEANSERLARLEVIATGQSLAMTQAYTSNNVAHWFRYYAGWCTKLGGEYYPDDDGLGYYKVVTYELLGVCAGLASWNATYLYAAWKIAPAVAAGNTVIFKSSEKSPLGALALGALVKEAGFPPGVINFVTGGGQTGHLLAAHMGISKISFTGSVTTGKKVQEAALKSNMKRVTLELGGKSPSIVFKDADIENALQHNSLYFLVNSGQACIASSRLLVQEDIAESFIEKLKTCFEMLANTMGEPTDPKMLLGPLVDKQQFDRVMGFIEQGQKDGAQLLCGGARKGDKGWFVEPTIFLNPPLDSSIYREEIFGPVLVVRTFKTEQEAIQLANDTVYGLSANIYTKDITRALRISSKLEAGMVSINGAMTPTMSTPFGGVKLSGLGRESGKAGLMAYMEPKTILINTKIPSSE